LGPFGYNLHVSAGERAAAPLRGARAVAGGLLAAAGYVLKGEKPADVPVVLPPGRARPAARRGARARRPASGWRTPLLIALRAGHH
jgi:hypothetical protein